MHEFFDGNRRAVHAVTIKDALVRGDRGAGCQVTGVEDLLSIDQVASG
jgi:hypothetical protein